MVSKDIIRICCYKNIANAKNDQHMFFWNQMKKSWKRIKFWMQIHAPHLIEFINTGTGTGDFVALETAIGKPLPRTFKKFYKTHNGQREGSDGFIDAEEMLSTQRMLGEWKTWKELIDDGTFKDIYSDPDPGIKNDWYNRYWIPITYDGAGNHLAMDLDPAAGGRVSQIISVDHDDGQRKLIAPTFKDFIKNYVRKLESGEYIYSAKWSGIVDKKKIEMWEA